MNTISVIATIIGIIGIPSIWTWIILHRNYQKSVGRVLQKYGDNTKREDNTIKLNLPYASPYESLATIKKPLFASPLILRIFGSKEHPYTLQQLQKIPQLLKANYELDKQIKLIEKVHPNLPIIGELKTLQLHYVSLIDNMINLGIGDHQQDNAPHKLPSDFLFVTTNHGGIQFHRTTSSCSSGPIDYDNHEAMITRLSNELGSCGITLLN